MTSNAGISAGKAPVTALRLAATSALLFFLICSTYILVSGQLAERVAQDRKQLARIEKTKGLLFMGSASLLFFGLAYGAMRRIERADELIRRGQEALMDAERRSLAGLFASSIAHDMRNILTIVGVGIDDLRKGRATPETATLSPQKIDRAFQELNQLAHRLMNIGKEGMCQDALDLDLREVVQGAVDFARSHPRIRDCNVTIHAPESIRTKASPHLLQLMMLNLMLNSADATRGAGHIRVTLHRNGDHADILVEDDGPGVDATVQQRLFTPFFTTKAGGTGLGLTSVKAVAHGHAGEVSVDASPLGGACFRVTLPITADGPA